MRIHNRVTPTVIRIRYIRLYGHPRGLATLTHHAERLAGELSLPVLKTLVCRIPESNPNFPHARQTLHQLSHCGVFFKKEKTFLYLTSVATLNELCTSLYNIISTSDISIWVQWRLNKLNVTCLTPYFRSQMAFTSGNCVFESQPRKTYVVKNR